MTRIERIVVGHIRRRLREAGVWTARDPVVVAFSGGPDSSALLAACRTCRPLAARLAAVHVNHGLHAEATEHEERAREIAARLGVPFHVQRLGRALAGARNLEARARAARYRALREAADALRAPWILTAHTADDQAETVLMRLIRGCGPAGLAAIEPVRADGVIRPALDCRRNELRALAATAGLPCVHDPMNRDPSFLRVRVRREILPVLESLNPRLVPALARLAAHAREEAEWLRAEARRWLGCHAPGGPQLDAEALGRLPRALAGEVIRQWLLGQGIPRHRLDSRRLEASADLAREAGRGAREIALGDGHRLARLGAYLVIDPAPAEEAWAPVLLEPGRTVRCGRRWRIAAGPPQSGPAAMPENLHEALLALAPGGGSAWRVRPPAPGDRVRPLGLGGTRKLSDCFTDRRVPAPLRRSWPVVTGAEGILWVPGVVRAEAAEVSSGSGRYVRLRAWCDCG